MTADRAARPKAAERRPGYSVEQTLAQPEFWRGAAAARAALYDADPTLQNGRGIVRAQTIGRKRAAGCPLAEISEFGEWLNAGLVRP